MSTWEAPAKLNLSLQVGERDREGLHPLRSLVQTIDWVDLLTMEEGDEDLLVVEGADLPEGGDNLVWKAVTALRRNANISRPFLDIRLEKRISVAAGLGGGSADAAAALLATARLCRLSPVVAEAVSGEVGSDVPFLMVGGTAWMEGHGELVDPVRMHPDYAVGVIVPTFELETAEVYQTWDGLGGPPGPVVEGRRLPPSLRSLGPFRNDLTAAAIHLQPELSDWIADLSNLLERPVMMTGSGPAVFAYFSDLDEAESAISMAPASARAATAALPRSRGPMPVDG